MRILPPLLVVAGVALLAGIAASTSTEPVHTNMDPAVVASVHTAAAAVEEHLQSTWPERGLTAAEPADELTVLRRLSLALCGTVPSLEEIRQFEADTQPHRLERWTAAILQDDRFVAYFAEKLARAFVGVEGGQFIIFRRDRFTEWLREQLREHRPYDEMVAEMISGTGVWTGNGQVNFVTAVFANDEFDRNKLTARTVRAFLGQRIDCAQCHDHPFDVWKQDQFEGLAAHYGQVSLSLVGVHDQQEVLFTLPADIAGPEVGKVTPEWRKAFRQNDQRLRAEAVLKVAVAGQVWIIEDGPQDQPDRMEARFIVRRSAEGLQARSVESEFIVEDRETLEPRVVEPAVPFHPEWLGEVGTRREQLAAWLTHPQNKRFERAIANRVWGLMFGKPFLTDRPVDDLPSPEAREYAADTRVLDLLGADFRAHGCDLRRLIQVIAATDAFRRRSVADVDDAQLIAMEEEWAIFPLVRLRPEQVIGAMLQANSVKTIDQNSHLFVRFLRFVRETDFVREFGDPGESELADRVGTIPQALLRLNGEFAQEMSGENPLTAPLRIAKFSGSPETAVENVFLACLTRRPTSEERDHFVGQLNDADNQPEGIIEDLFWTLYNSPEFSWNH